MQKNVDLPRKILLVLRKFASGPGTVVGEGRGSPGRPRDDLFRTAK
jgi:hypothetical protein